MARNTAADEPHRTDDIYTADSKTLKDEGYDIEELEDGRVAITPGRNSRVDVSWVGKVMENLGYEKVRASPSEVVVEYEE